MGTGVHRGMVLAAVVALALLPAACGSDASGDVVGDGVLVADEAVYPGLAGPVLGGIARSDGQAALMWETVGFSGDPPALAGQALVVVAGGQAGPCTWDLSGVTVQGASVTLALGESGAGEFCERTWRPRALALTVAAGTLDDGAEVRVVQPWGEEQIAVPIADRPDPARWESRVLVSGDIGREGGCGDALVYATTADGTVALLVRWDGAASRAASEGGFSAEVDLPDPGVTVLLQAGTHLPEGLCTDVIVPGQPLLAGEWDAVSGRLAIAVEPEEGATRDFPHGRATVTLEAVELAPRDDAGGEPWRIDGLELRDIWVGWLPG